jgi:hypothetical protein
LPFALSLSKGTSIKACQQGFDKLSPSGKKTVRPEPVEGLTADRRSP